MSACASGANDGRWCTAAAAWSAKLLRRCATMPAGTTAAGRGSEGGGNAAGDALTELPSSSKRGGSARYLRGKTL